MKLPENFDVPSILLNTLHIEDIVLNYQLTPDGDVAYTVFDALDGIEENNRCTIHQFNCAVAAATEDEDMTTEEYEEAERAMGPLVRWIP